MLTVDFDRLGLRPGDRVLDMGCGAGRHAFEMYRRGGDVIAFDMDADELAMVSDLFHAMKQAGEGMKSFGKKVGQAGKEAGGEIAEASKKIWFKGKQVSAKLLRQTQDATRKWWRESIEKKDDSLRDLRKENAKLKRELADKEKE